MRRLRDSRLIKIAGIAIAEVLGILVILSLLKSVAGRPDVSYYESQGYIKAYSQSCVLTVTNDRKIRLAATVYVKPKGTGELQIDPNTGKVFLGYGFREHMVILIPEVDYEVTQDGGRSWKVFWQFENIENERHWCKSFDSLDADNFWLWTSSWIAITHDGGETWIVQDGRKEWNINTDNAINQVSFDTPEAGQIIFVDPDLALITDDGGETWRVDTH